MATPRFELRITTPGNLLITRTTLEQAFANASNAAVFANMRVPISLGEVWSERTYSPDSKGFHVYTYFTVATEVQANCMDDARLLVSAMIGPNSYTLNQYALVSKPKHSRELREKWCKVGHDLEDLDYTSTQLANLGAEPNPATGLFNLPSRIRDKSEYPAFAELIEGVIASKTVPSHLASLLAQEFVDLEPLRKQVEEYNLIRLRAVLALRGAQADGLRFRIPVFDPAPFVAWQGPDFRAIARLDD